MHTHPASARSSSHPANYLRTTFLILLSLTLLFLAPRPGFATQWDVYPGQLAWAVDHAQAYDTIVLHNGTYHEVIMPNVDNLTIKAAPGEKPIVSGSQPIQPYWNRNGNIHYATWNREMCRPWRFAYETKMFRGPGTTVGQIFVKLNGTWQMYKQMGDKDSMSVTPGSWYTDGTWIYINVPSGINFQQLTDLGYVQATTFPQLLVPKRRYLRNITVCGITFSRAANQYPLEFWENTSSMVKESPSDNDPITRYYQEGMVTTASGRNWVIENCRFEYANSIGLDFGSQGGSGWLPEPSGAYVGPVGSPIPAWTVRLDDSTAERGYHTIRNNVFADNGVCGLAGWRSIGVQITGNIIQRNAVLGLGRSDEDAGLKAHWCINGVIKNNLIRDNEANGLWLDQTWQGTVVRANVILRNLNRGIMVELGGNPNVTGGDQTRQRNTFLSIDNNIIACTRATENASAGIYMQDASQVMIAHNLFYKNDKWGVWFRYLFGSYYWYFDGDTINSLNQYGYWTRSEASFNNILNNLFVGNTRGAISWPYPEPTARHNFSDHNDFLDPQGYTNGRPFQVNQYGVDERYVNMSNRLSSLYGWIQSQVGNSYTPDATGPLTHLLQWRNLYYNSNYGQSACRCTNDPNSQLYWSDASLGSFGLTNSSGTSGNIYLQMYYDPSVGYSDSTRIGSAYNGNMDVTADFFGNYIQPNCIPGPFQSAPTYGTAPYTVWQGLKP